MTSTLRVRRVLAPFVAAISTSLLLAPASAQTVRDVAARGACSTSGVTGISQQLMEVQMCTGGFTAFVPFAPYPNISLSSGVRPFAQASARNAIQATADTRSLAILSAFRTVADQYVLYHSGGCRLAAAPGRSNHQSGRAIDVTNHDAARAALEAHGCVWFGDRDPAHFDCPGADLRDQAIRAFQHLWNVNNPGARIAEDGIYGPITDGKLAGSPAAGFPTTGCAPPSCDDTAGGFTFSCDGLEDGQHCVSLNEPGDPDSWSDNYLCSVEDVGFVFSTEGPVDGMRCANLHEPADPYADAWADDYACVPEDSTIDLAWSNAGPLDGWDCVRWNEPSDTGTWNDNYLCTRPVRCSSAGDFTFCSDGPREGMDCVSVDEPMDPDTWDNNYFCSAEPIGMVWSHDGPIDSMTCTAVTAPDDMEGDAWADDYLCLPDDSPYVFLWSDSGPIEGMDCVRWYESVETDDQGWTDNYLCVTAATLGGADAGRTGADAGVAGSVDAGDPDAASLSGSCACRAAPGRPAPWPLAGLILVLGGLLRRRARGRAKRSGA